MGLGCNYVLLDAQTIQMVKVDEALGNKGSLGRQFIMQAVAQVPLKHIFKRFESSQCHAVATHHDKRSRLNESKTGIQTYVCYSRYKDSQIRL